ncbi:MAG: hypothetical protein KDD04_01540 [Sinomicrobium sp.]|nr:hypothetical protein [Sinomicrobium sp.]
MNTKKPITVIPVIDFAAYFSDERQEKEHLAKQLHTACKDIGFFYLENHGVSKQLIGDIFKQAKALFSLPEKEKMAMHVKHSKAQRGYFPAMEENTNKATYDLKEGFDMSRDLPEDHVNVRKGLTFYGPNVYPESLPSFKPVLDAYYNEMWKLGTRLLNVFAIALGLPETFFDDKVNDPMAQLRLLHYPPHHKRKNSNVLSCGEHTDYGCITILYVDNVSGLQLKDKTGNWIDVPSLADKFIINIGEIMERWTNGLYSATEHRVPDNGGLDRYSVPFFFDPNHEAMIECIPTCISASNPPKYKPVKASDYLAGRFDDSFSYRKDKTLSGATSGQSVISVPKHE